MAGGRQRRGGTPPSHRSCCRVPPAARLASTGGGANPTPFPVVTPRGSTEAARHQNRAKMLHPPGKSKGGASKNAKNATALQPQKQNRATRRLPENTKYYKADSYSKTIDCSPVGYSLREWLTLMVPLLGQPTLSRGTHISI